MMYFQHCISLPRLSVRGAARGKWSGLFLPINGVRVADLNSFLFMLQVSRSIGDVYLKRPDFYRDPIFRQFGNPIPLKRPVMTAEPSIIIRELESDDLFLIFASDGLWEQLSDEAAVDIVFKYPRAVSVLCYL
jgi:serine/threonine protein phosphatase PrpC